MLRRTFLTAPLALVAMPTFARQPAKTFRTIWSISSSEGIDALAFLGPLSGKPFYASYYEMELAAFRPRLDAATMTALMSLHAEHDSAGSLLWPNLTLIFSGGPDGTIADLLTALDAAESVLRPKFAASAYWDQQDWRRFIEGRDRLRVVLSALRDAKFARFRHDYMAGPLARRTTELNDLLSKLDVITEQERLLGRSLDPRIAIELSWFCRPHGVRVQGQRFISHVAASDQVTLLTAAHEILHPPFDMKGPVAQACYRVLETDPLFARILAEKDPATGYNDLEGILNEDTCQALDQIIQDRLELAARTPADRWSRADQGMHVLAAGLYGLLRSDGYDRTGGNLETWMLEAARSGKLSPIRLHAAAAATLQKPIDRLWVRPTI